VAGAFSSAFSSAFDVGAAAPVEETPAVGADVALGGGWGAPVGGRGGRVDFDERRKIADQLRDLYREVYAKTEQQPASEAAEEAAALVSEYAPAKGPDLPPPQTVDWALIAQEGAAAVADFRAALIRIQEMLAEQDDEDAVLVLMLAD
jgi:hypothetical protein